MHATPRDAVILLFILFQFAATAAMLSVRGPARKAGRLLAGLFFVNAVIGTLLWLLSPLRNELGQQWGFDALEASRSLDVLTLYIIAALAVVAWRDERLRSKVPWVVGAGGAVAVFTWLPRLAGRIFVAPAASVPGWGAFLELRFQVFEWHTALFNLGVALVIVVLARGPAWARWVGLALAPRVLYWTVFGLDALISGPRTHLLGVVNDVSQVLAGAIALGALARPAWAGKGPSPLVIAAALLVGPITGLIQLVELRAPGIPVGAQVQIMNLATLALVRPLVAVVGLAPRRLWRVSAHAVASAAAAFLVLAGAGFAIGTRTDLGGRLAGLAAAVLVLLILEGRRGEAGTRPTGSAGPVQPGDVVAGRYEVTGPLGQGASGVTVAAHDRDRGQEVALKILHEGVGAEMADRERRAMERLDHPNVVTCYGVEASPSGIVLVMEHVQGETLEDRLRDGSLDEGTVRKLGEELLGALEAVHEAGLVHRDVKPSNLLVSEEHGLKLTDFNVARVPDLDATLSAEHPAAVPVGTMRYMAPEVARGLSAGQESDLYAAGAVLYEALTGQAYVPRRPGQSAARLRDRVASLEGFDRPVGSEDLATFFATALHPEPGARFPSAARMLEAWRSALPPGD